MENKYDIEEWVATRGFDELTEPEKEIVINELGSQAAYTEMRKIVLTFQSADEEIIPSAVRHSIMDAFDLHHNNSDIKIIPIAQPRERSYKKIIAYALLAASIIVGVFLILPDKSNSSNHQIAENKIKKEISSDSVEPAQNAKKEVENAEDTENLEMKKEITNELKAPGLKDTRIQEVFKVETELSETQNENTQSFSAKSNNDFALSDKADVTTDAMGVMEEQSLAKIAAPPTPMKEMSLNQENKNTAEQQAGMRHESFSLSNAEFNFTLKIEDFSQNHYISY